MVEHVVYDGVEIAVIIRHSFNKAGIYFFTPSTYSQQLGYINRPAGHVIEPHIHNLVSREVHRTQEFLYIKSGRVRVDFYSDHQEYIESTIVSTGDVILLACGGHGFEMLEQSEVIEVKQGPYAGDADKTRFTPAPKNTCS